MNFPIISSLILLPIIGSFFLIFIKPEKSNNSIKYVALFISIANLILSIYLWIVFDQNNPKFQFVESRDWMSGIINYKVGIDGISILFVVLTTLITPLCVISVNSTITYRLKDR